MHSIAMPCLPACSTISSFIASSTPCCPFLSLTPLSSPLKKTRYPDATISKVPSLSVSSSPITDHSLQHTTQRGVDVADTVSAFYSCCANVERAERELIQPRPRPGGLVVRGGGLPLLLCRFFRANSLRLSLSSRFCLPMFLPSFFKRVGCSTLNTPRLLHRRHFCLLARALRASLLSSLRVPRFSRRQCTNFAARLPRNSFALLSCITTSR